MHLIQRRETPYTMREAMIEKLMPTAASIGAWYAKTHGRTADDMVSAAYLGLCKAAANPPAHNNFIGHAIVTIHGACKQAIEDENIVERRARRKIGTRYKVAIQETEIERDPAHNMIAEELMARFDKRERIVVEMRMEGFTQTEIATTLSVSQPMIYKILASIKEKLGDLLY